MSFAAEVRKPGRSLAWLVDIEAEGIHEHLAERMVLVDGEKYHGLSKIAPLPSVRLNIFEPLCQPGGLQLTISRERGLINYEENYAVKLKTAIVTLRLWVEGEAGDCCRTYKYSVSRYAADEYGQITIYLDPLWSKWNKKLPDKAITGWIWPNSDENTRHYPYPIIYGAANKLRLPVVDGTGKKAMVAGHHIAAVGSCWVDGAAQTGTLSNTTDSAGNEVGLATFTATIAGKTVVANVEGWGQDGDFEQYFGEDASTITDFSNPAGILFHLLGVWGELENYLHWPSLGTARALFKGWKLGLVVNREADLLVVANRLCRWMGAAIYPEDGLIKMRRVEVDDPRVAGHLLEGKSLISLSYAPDWEATIVNRLKLFYGLLHDEGRFSGSVLVDRMDYGFLQKSYRWYGEQRQRDECADTSDEWTAEQIALRLCSLSYKERRVLEAVCTREALGFDLLDCIDLTHGGLGLSGSKALIIGREDGLASCKLTLMEV